MKDDVFGITVYIGARVVSKTEVGQILVSNTLRETAAGSGIRFTSTGLHELKSISGQWAWYAVEP